MRRDREIDETRCALAIAAAAGTVLICMHQQHFTLSLADPHSFVVMTMHRCGVMVLAVSAWAAVECVALLLLPARMQQAA